LKARKISYKDPHMEKGKTLMEEKHPQLPEKDIE